MIRRTIIILILLLTSCVKHDIQKIQEDTMYPMEEQYITVPTNKVAILTTKTDTLAILTRSSTVLTPKGAYIDLSMMDNSNNSYSDRYKIWQTVVFEDSKAGDYDYNDLVIHVKIEQKNNNTLISVHPIALGATKKITLGITIDGRDYIIAENCRVELFRNETGFINTFIGGKRIKFEKFAKKNIPTTSCTFGKSLDWFILVDGGTKLYAVSKNYPVAARPYGLIIVDINDPYKYNGYDCGLDWFDYPSEGVSIEAVYPLFFDKNKSFKEIYSNKMEGFYNAIVSEGRIATKECLYAINE